MPDIVPLAPIDLFGHYQHVNTGYPINSGDSTRVSLGCFHHLTTYLSVLSGVPRRSTRTPAADLTHLTAGRGWSPDRGRVGVDTGPHTDNPAAPKAPAPRGSGVGALSCDDTRLR